jgi:hypothetical protein
MGREADRSPGLVGEAPALALIFAKSLVGFDGIVREAIRCRAAGPALCSGNAFRIGRSLPGVANQGPRLGSVSAQSGIFGANTIRLAKRFSLLRSLAPPTWVSIAPIRPFAGAPTRRLAQLHRGNLGLLAGELG